MSPLTLRTRAAALAACLCLPAGLAAAGPAQARVSRSAAKGNSEAALLRALLHSRELWATIDVCSPSDQPDTIGVRGSMPGDRHARDTMWMSFRLQYMNSSSKQWIDLSSASTKYIAVGHGGSVRQAGRSFQLVPKSGHAASTLRGVVDYQWRRGARVLQSETRSTGGGHSSRAGADPAGYSAASCIIG